MSLTHINHNIMAMNAQRNLNLNQARLGQSIERLSSGLRINSAADDPSGLVLSEGMRADVSGLNVVQQNISEGVNLIKTAEGALAEVNSLLRQMNDLALDAASSSNNSADTRIALQDQVDSAITSINAIAANTKYAGVTLLDGSAGTDVNVLEPSEVASMKANNSAVEGYASINLATAAAKASQDTSHAYTAATDSLANAGTITINGVTVNSADGDAWTTSDTVQNVIDQINASTDQHGVTAEWDGTDSVTLTQTSYGSAEKIVYSESADILNGGSGIDVAGTDAVVEIDWDAATFATADVTLSQGQGLTAEDGTGNVLRITEELNADGAATSVNKAAYITQGEVSFQIGLTASEAAGMAIDSAAASDLGTTGSVANIDISTVAGAQSALTVLEEAMDEVSSLRGELGAFQSNELESQARSQAIARENLTASESAIRDTDFGQEMAEYSVSQITVQSATAFLAQANGLPKNVLGLIGGGG